MTIIYLGCRLPGTSSNLPADQMRRAASLRLFGLAPGGVYRAFNVTIEAVSSYLAFSPLSRCAGLCIFCGTVPRSPGVRVTDHPAPWSSDFPHPVHKRTRRDRLTCFGILFTNELLFAAFHLHILGLPNHNAAAYFT